MYKKFIIDLMWSLLFGAVLIILVLIPIFALVRGRYTIASIYLLLVGVFFIYIKWEKLTNSIKNLAKDKLKLKRLDYYYITDADKIIDLEKRREIYYFLGNMIVGITLFITICITAIYFENKSLFGKFYLQNVIEIIGLSMVIIFWYGGMLLKIVYRNPIAIYVFTPIFSGIIFWMLIHSIKFSAPLFIKFGLYLLIPSIFYFMLVCFFPVHVLRSLNSRTLIISSFTSIMAVILSLVMVQNVQNGNILPEEIISNYEISNVFNIGDMKDKQMIELINHLKVKVATDIITSELNLMVSGLTIAYIIGALMVGKKIEKDKKRANNLYRSIVMSDSPIEYKVLVECAFYGGKEYENILLSNERMAAIIRKNEKNIFIPDVSRRVKFTKFLRKTVLGGLICSMYDATKSNRWSA